MVLRLGELFCGPGGIALGAKLASVEGISIEHAWAVDYDKDSCETYKRNIIPQNSKIVIQKDVRNLDIDSLKPIDFFAFGFPCNDFSLVGKQKGMDGPFGPLYSYGVNIINKFKPKIFLAENVGGLKSSNEGKALSTILEKLENEGYNITPHLYKFEYYGVPQTRHRIFIVGIRNDLDYIFKVPTPSHVIPKTSREALENPPIPKSAYNQELTNQSEQVINRLKFIKPGGNAFSEGIPESLQMKINGAKISMIYKRLDPDKPSYTVTGSGGGGTHVYHWEENRALTNRERARLQTFPDDFVFCGSKESVRKQIGMAVPPLAAKFIIEAIFKTISGVFYESMPSNIHVKPIFNNSITTETLFI